MQKLYIAPTRDSPEIIFSPEENNFIISGTSAPEDVRALYYPVIDWFKEFAKELSENEKLTEDILKPIRFRIDLKYFNSSSAKFLFDILVELKNLINSGAQVIVVWYYEKDDPDLKEAGNDLSDIAGMEFEFVEKD
jgi:hypothetical protein